VINRADRSNEWRRDAVIPPLRAFLAAAIAADELIAVWEIGRLFGDEPGLRNDHRRNQIGAHLVAARAARIDLDLFAPELGVLAAGVVAKVIDAQMRVQRDPPEGDIAPASVRPSAVAIDELERQARIVCRLERRTAREFLARIRALRN